VPEEVKRERFRRVMERQRDISRDHQRALVGRRIEVLVEGSSEETEHLLVGRHAQQAPEIDGVTFLNEGMAYPGELVVVEVTDADDYDLVGRVVARDEARAGRRPAGGRTASKRAGLKVLR
jgi:ribosomal protein S12 methylthiotransferase